MAEMPDVIGGETITEDWGNSIRDRAIMRYATAADRTTEHPTPTAGDLSFLEDSGRIEVYHAGQWTSAYVRAGTTAQTGIVQLSSSTSSGSTQLAATASAVKAAYDIGNHSHSAYAPTHSHPYAATSHNHNGHTLGTLASITSNAAVLGDVTVTGDLALQPGGTLSSPHVEADVVEVNGGLTTDELSPGTLWPYNNVNGSLRWMGTFANFAQSHTPSSVEHKKNIKPVDPAKGVFARLDPIHFSYKESHPHKDRFGESWAAENPPMGRMGFTYEQVTEVAPQWAYEADGMKAVSYEGMLPDFIAWAVATITGLSDRVSVLEAKLGEADG